MTRAGWRWLAAVWLLAAAVIVVFAVEQASADGTPGWEPQAGVLGTITFYDANGQVVTGGDTSVRPFAFYAAASADGRPGDSKAQLKIFTPSPGVNPALWSGDTVTGSTDYPVAHGPAAVTALTTPVASATSVDFSLDDYLSELPNTATDPAYANLYEVRLYTSGAGQAQSFDYFRVDIRVSQVGAGKLWSVVYPAPAGSSSPPTDTATATSTDTATTTATATAPMIVTTTGLTADPPSPVTPGTRVTLTIQVHPAGLAGVVTIDDGAVAVATADYNATTGTASVVVDPMAGTHVLGAGFVPHDPAAATASGSSTIVFSVVASPFPAGTAATPTVSTNFTPTTAPPVTTAPPATTPPAFTPPPVTAPPVVLPPVTTAPPVDVVASGISGHPVAPTPSASGGDTSAPVAAPAAPSDIALGGSLSAVAGRPWGLTVTILAIVLLATTVSLVLIAMNRNPDGGL